MSEQKLLPELRFPEFEASYNKFEFSEIAKRRKSTYNPKLDSKNYQCIELESLSQETGLLLKTFNSIELKSTKSKFKKHDVLFGKLRPYLKKFLIPDFEGVCTSEIWVLYGIKVENQYLYYLIQTSKFNYEANMTLGSKMPRADWSYVSSIIYSIPTLPEQQKIAAFLTAVDKRIELLEKKKALLEQYKKGVMQKIFSQEIRFRKEDGSDFENWEEKKLGEVATINKGTQLNSEFLTEEGSYPCLNGGIMPSGYTEDYNRKGEVVTISEGGNSCGYVNFMENNFWCGGHCYTIDVSTEDVNNRWLFQYLKFNQSQIMRLRVGSGLPNIQKGDLLKFRISLPNQEEQIHIAKFLSSFDKVIESIDSHISGSQIFKKGLLQKMFV